MLCPLLVWGGVQLENIENNKMAWAFQKDGKYFSNDVKINGRFENY